MLMPRVIPCLDLRDGRIVKGVRFQNLRDAGDPLEQVGLACARRAAEEQSAVDGGERVRDCAIVVFSVVRSQRFRISATVSGAAEVPTASAAPRARSADSSSATRSPS